VWGGVTASAGSVTPYRGILGALGTAPRWVRHFFGEDAGPDAGPDAGASAGGSSTAAATTTSVPVGFRPAAG
jgi:hypothetical protein